jgi:hypothetical protein
MKIHVTYGPEFWVCCRGIQDTSPPKRIITFGGVDLREHRRQFGAAVLLARSRRGSGNLVAWGRYGHGGGHGEGLTYIGEDLGLVLGLQIGPWINRLVGAIVWEMRIGTGRQVGCVRWAWWSDVVLSMVTTRHGVCRAA